VGKYLEFVTVKKIISLVVLYVLFISALFFGSVDLIRESEYLVHLVDISKIATVVFFFVLVLMVCVWELIDE